MGILEKINNRINRNPYYLDFRHSLKCIYYRNDFKDIRTMVLTIGFSNTGSSLLGSLLTAHPNLVIAHEIQYGRKTKAFGQKIGAAYLHRKYKGTLSNLFYNILVIDSLRYQDAYLRHSKGQQKEGHYTLVSNQHQGRFERLKVIGVKASTENSIVLLRNNTLVNFRRKLEKRDIKLKFLLTIRNPYDRVVGISKRNKFGVEKACRVFEDACKRQEEILKRTDPQDVFVNRHEDMCKDPRQQLARLCDFLQVPIPVDYIEDCASAIVREPYKHRLDINWSPKLKQTVALIIEKYDFLSGYD